jgi:hypothetical protein
MRPRYLAQAIMEDLPEKMVILGGPRQVGKTTLARMISAGFRYPVYLNWDNRRHRRTILDGSWSPDADLVILDEVHKQEGWRSLVKGYWDTRPEGQAMVVTGSARLDILRRSGESMLGRFVYYTLHPFSLAELAWGPPPDHAGPAFPIRPRFDRSEPRTLERLLRFGGFPEPYLKAEERYSRRWRLQREEALIREDVLSLESVQRLTKLEQLVLIAGDCVAVPLSFNSLARDLEVSPKTVKSWVNLLERNCFCFTIPPHSGNIRRSLRKRRKLYLWDWSAVSRPGPRLENLVASHLLKAVHYLRDRLGYRAGLWYLRDAEGREVDFLVTVERKPAILLEVKGSAATEPAALSNFRRQLDLDRAYLVVGTGGVDSSDRGNSIRTISADRFLASLV